MVKEVDEQLEIQKVVHVSDKGMISANDKEEILANKGGYIFGTPLSKTDADAKAYIPDETGYKHPNASERMTVNERQIVFREEDGYHVIHTNVIGSEDESSSLFRLERPATALDIIDMYRGLWRIKERFLGSNQEKESIEAHLLSSFVSLLILKILELKTGKTIEFEKMVDDLRRLQVVEETDDVYLLLEPTNIIKAIGDAMDLDLVKVRYTARELKNLVAKTRKQGMVPDSARG
jgi:transposase